MAFCVEQNINKTYICSACRQTIQMANQRLALFAFGNLKLQFSPPLSTLPNCWSREDFIIFLPRQQNWREFQFAIGFILPAFHAPRIWRNGIARDSAVGTAQAFQFKLAFLNLYKRHETQLSNEWWMPARVLKGFEPTIWRGSLPLLGSLS